MDIDFRRHEIKSIFRYEGVGEVLASYHLGTEGRLDKDQIFAEANLMKPSTHPILL